MACSSLIQLFLLSTLAVGALSVDWSDLRVRFGTPLSGFFHMKRTEKEAANDGFRLDVGCSVSNGFVGRRYVKTDGDRSIMLLFDSQGTIAGIQTAIPKSSGFPTAKSKWYHNVYLETPTEHLLTAYFVDPATICNGGRPSSTLDTIGTGDRLVMQVGKATSLTHVNVVQIPRQESDIPSTKWTKGKCFVWMGQHYWYNMRMDMNCDDFFPAFLLYHSGKLNGFGFAITANYDGQYYEHPTLSLANGFFPFIPTCMHKPGFPTTFTTVHVYFNSPYNKLCLF